MDDPIFKTKYQKYKYKVKLWEKDFTTKYGRIPSKHDIKEAPTAIKQSYKMYYKLKSSFLEETLSEALEDDSFDLSLLDTSSQMDSSLTNSFSEISTPDLTQLTNGNSSLSFTQQGYNSIEINRSRESDIANDTTVQEPTSANSSTLDNSLEKLESFNNKAWGDELNVKRTGEKKSNVSELNEQKELGSKLRKSMSDKLFRNSSFSKRNPRKSLSKLSLQSSESNTSLKDAEQRESLPDLETILAQKTLKEDTDSQDHKQKLANDAQQAANLANNIDHEWLNRCNRDNSLTSETLEQRRPDISSNRKTVFGLTNINANALNIVEAAPISTVTDKKTMLNFDLKNLDIQSEEKSVKNVDSIGDVDEIANSEDESNTQSELQFRSIRHRLKKRKHSEIENATEQKAVIAVNDEAKPSNNKNNKDPIKSRSIKMKPVPEIRHQRAENLRRKGLRTKKNVPNYNQKESDGESNNESDPFAGDDSDADPEFTVGNKKSTKNSPMQRIFNNIRNTISSDSDSNSTKKVDNKTEKKAKRKVVVKTKSVVRLEKKLVIKTKLSQKSRPKMRKAENDEENKEIDDTNPNDYLMEFGLGTIKGVPSVDVQELEKTTQTFHEFINSTTISTSIRGDDKTECSSANSNVRVVSKRTTAKEKLEKKMAAGTLNENFVRINLRKKVFVRGKKQMNFSRYKKTLWKQKKRVAALTGPEMDMGGCDGGILTCFQCGMPGHFAQNCKVKSDKLLPLDAVQEESPFPTLQEIEAITKKKAKRAHAARPMPETDNPLWKLDTDANENSSVQCTKTESDSDHELDESVTPFEPKYIGHKIPEDFLIKAGLLNDDENQVSPLYKLKENGDLIATPDEVYEALEMFGHAEFRNGQEKAIMRILSGQSTLVTLSTGSGKSLCYQLPAYLYSRKHKCITLVISPLVSLMEDQAHNVPHFLNAQCLHTNQAKAKRDSIMESIKSGQVHVLLISPEAVVAGEKSTGFGALLRDLPPIAFVCIDEAHCVSQWSHNFRPSYLMLCRVLRDKLKVRTVLGLTATATLATRQSIVTHLSIPDGLSGVISDVPLPDNLILTVSRDENRDSALVRLLKEDRFAAFKSIIVYCTRRDECERIAKYLRTYFQDNINEELKTASGKRKRNYKTNIEPYHAGLPASRRRTIQNAFMRGDVKIVVATIAFGMGINKSDIRAVIHYNMPMSFESYVQEVGRAGRDGLIAHCHLFLDSKGTDKLELRRHIYADSIDRHAIRKLLQKIFVSCACSKSKKKPQSSNSLEDDIEAVQNISWNDDMTEEAKEEKRKQRSCPGHEICFSVDATVNELDIPEENISTLLCYLELHENSYIKALSKAYVRCKVFSYGGPKVLRAAALSCPPLAMAIALDLKRGISHDNSSFIEFPVVDIASAIGWNSGVVKYQLKNLEWTAVNGLPKRSTISVEFTDLGFRVLAPGDLSDNELNATLDLLYSRVKNQERTQLAQLQQVFEGLESVSVGNCINCVDTGANDERSEKLKSLIRKYFQSVVDPTDDIIDAIEEEENKKVSREEDAQIINDIRTMISRYPENKFTGRALARIFHGVSSPVYPAVIWAKCKYWRSHIKTDFKRIATLANAEILKISI